MKQLTQSYLTTALWSSNDENDEPFDNKYSPDDFAAEDIQAIEKELDEFLMLAERFLKTPKERDTVEHDFWLTRNHHGAGFWDGDYVNGDKLTELAKRYRECYVYLGDDKKLHIG
jgi:hypothetical protein